MIRSTGSSSSGTSAARIDVCDERSSSQESGQTSMLLARADEHVAGHERRVLRQPPQRLVDLGHGKWLHAGRSLLSRGVALDELGELRSCQGTVSRIATGSPRRSTSRSSASKNRSRSGGTSGSIRTVACGAS